ncbi:MAG: 7-cyano-7-deazaguanine synthase [Candidatus Omnitrophica bacterium]|nr:7-cyano-7-deazaguanine synthase [Candidatus Omnitrophota bacterium]
MSHAGVVALVSGGLDSLCLARALLAQRKTVHPVYIRCGLVWEAAELFWLREWLAKLRRPGLRALTVLQVPLAGVYARHWSLTGRGVPSRDSRDAAVYLPGRNVLLVAHAALYAARERLSTIALGILAGNPFADARPELLKRLSGVLSRSLSHRLRVAAPLRRLSKAALIAKFPREPFELTFSCLRPEAGRHCGRCNKCAERQRAFAKAGVPDPTSYAQQRRGQTPQGQGSDPFIC